MCTQNAEQGLKYTYTYFMQSFTAALTVLSPHLSLTLSLSLTHKHTHAPGDTAQQGVFPPPPLKKVTKAKLVSMYTYVHVCSYSTLVPQRCMHWQLFRYNSISVTLSFLHFAPTPLGRHSDPLVHLIILFPLQNFLNPTHTHACMHARTHAHTYTHTHQYKNY